MKTTAKRNKNNELTFNVEMTNEEFRKLQEILTCYYCESWSEEGKQAKKILDNLNNWECIKQ